MIRFRWIRWGALEQEALLEIGNVILNACVGGMANAFGEEITVELPDYIETDASLSFAAPEDVNGGVMLLKMDFRIQGERYPGFWPFYSIWRVWILSWFW